jgi:hypothetical protein
MVNRSFHHLRHAKWQLKGGTAGKLLASDTAIDLRAAACISKQPQGSEILSLRLEGEGSSF